MNINLGAPYEASIKSIIEKGYAGSQTEVIRQAILTYERTIEEEELALVHKVVEIKMQDIQAKKSKTYSFEDIKKIIKR
jgi:Arc/MetJ-type ribon-helix-helix transcriptional regulator